MNTPRTDRVRLLVFLKKREDITTEEFDRYWLDEHSKVSLNLTTGNDAVLKYEQLHVNQEEKAKLKEAGVPVLDYDGVVLFDTDSFEKFGALMSDEAYIRDVIPDEEKFVVREESVVVRVNIVPIVDRDEELVVTTQTESARSAYIKPSATLRSGRSRMLYTFIAKEGVNLSEAWLQEHAAVVKATPLGESMIKYEQLHLTGPFVGLADNPNLKLPSWDGLALIDVSSFDTLKDPVSKRMLATDGAKWQVPGTLSMLPVNVATIVDINPVPRSETKL